MVTKKKMTLTFYQNLGKLFYAIAASDGSVKSIEFDKLKAFVKKQWLEMDAIEDFFGTDAAYQIEVVFDWLNRDEESDIKLCYEDFISYKKEQSHLFTEDVRHLILKTASSIAHAFSGINKSELIMLAKLDIELKKTLTMNYYFTKIVKGPFDAVENRVVALLKNEGFGVLTQIDIQTTLNSKLQVDFKKYKILGACNPSFAYKALQLEDKIGTMLPCNIIIQEQSPNSIEVSAVNPLVSMQEVKNDALNNLAHEVSAKLEKVIKSIENEK
jgi:uncharacterized protein (DUF302 family)